MGKLSQAGLATFLTLSSLVGCNKQVQNPNTPKSKTEEYEKYVTEKREYARRICDSKGAGRHTIPHNAPFFHMGDEIICFYPQGINTGDAIYDMPPLADKLDFESLPAIIKGKKAMLFGWDHGGGWSKPKNLEFFKQTMPILKSEGFTHVGLEYDQTAYQSIIDQFYIDNDEEKLRTTLGYHKVEEKYKGAIDDHIQQIISAEENGLKIECIDARHKDYYPEGKLNWDRRDSLMYRNVQDIISGNNNRIAIFIGAGHVSHNVEEYILNGGSLEGMPAMYKLNLPLGHRLHREYKEGEVGSVELNCNEGERFVDGCIDIE